MRGVRASDFESKSKMIDSLDSDMILEVPDTPDKTAAKRPVDGSSKLYRDRDNISNTASSREPYIPKFRRSCFYDSSSSSAKLDDTEFLFREANLARQLSNSSETDKSRETIDLASPKRNNISHHTRCQEPWRNTGRSLGKDKAENLCGHGLNTRDKGKAIDLGNNSKHINVTSCVENSRSSANRKGIDLRDSNFASIQPTRQTVASRRRLVRNGCISPLNTEHSRNDGKQKEVEVGGNGNLLHQVHLISPDSDGKRANNMKAKVAIEDMVVDTEESVRGRSQSSRVNLLPGKVTVISDIENGDDGWGTTSDHMKKSSSSTSFRTDSISKCKDASSGTSNRFHEVLIGNGSPVNVLQIDPEVTSLEHETYLQMEGRGARGKRKLGSSNCHVGEPSSSNSTDVGRSNRTCRQPLNSRSTRTCRSQQSGLIPIIEVDESPDTVPNVSGVSDYNVAHERQVESDELLARQLQEEFYNETPRIGGTDEINAALTLLLQDGEGQHASVSRRRRNLPSSSSRTRLRQTASRGRLPTYGRVAQLRRNFTLLDLDMSMLGGFAFGGDGNAAGASNIHHIQRDFNENDYEMLLALDENNNQHSGASESQINNLPQSIIQNADSQEDCAVCLETPALGDTIRHLPCMHKFHKECIDTWLQRKRSCPICKFDIR